MGEFLEYIRQLNYKLEIERQRKAKRKLLDYDSADEITDLD